ncbi:hemerythrin domain-containing protein [Actinoplanes sp. NPDC051343]|uniref:hemerythrin domain-containing protein n=1 Tax=Actinoplanes sp. NPDC051343 TaxID=3363906 RepID=UPI0037A46E8B
MMANHTETAAEASERRARLRGSVDFTMMYVAHDAFNRDLTRLIEAAERGHGFHPSAVTTWQMFSRQLHTHHTAEDTALWPTLHQVAAGNETDILADMEAEHAAIDPRLERIEAAIADRDDTGLLAQLQALGTELSDHMRHEEESALPLLERRLGAAGWEAFTTDIRQRVGGIKGGAQYLPWLLDGAAPAARRAVLKALPPPARLLFRAVWEPRHQRSPRLA